MQGNWNYMYGYNPYYRQYPAQGYQTPPQPSGAQIYTGPSQQVPIGPPGLLPIEQSYIENILRLNIGKVATVYMTFENNEKWNAKVFKGVIEAAGRDHLILSDPQTGKRYLLLMVYVDYITFDEEIEYTYPIGQMTTYSPRKKD